MLQSYDRLRVNAGLVGLFLFVCAAQADVRMPKIFSDSMVVQRDMRARVWGWAEPGEAITVSLAGRHAATNAETDGTWQVRLEPVKAGGPFELIVAGKNRITFTDVLVGDVWICSGQSNMEWLLKDCDNGVQAALTATNTQIRLITVKPPNAIAPTDDIPNGWVVCTPQTAGYFSGVGYFFGRRIQAETGIPIGLIVNAWGGTCIETWINDDGLELVAETEPLRQQMHARLAQYERDMVALIEPMRSWAERAQAAVEQKNPIPAPAVLQWPVHPRTGHQELGSIYNGRIAPLTPFAIKGAIWYQGESNGGEGESYYSKMRALIGGWRKAWNQGDFPFYFVQLANFQGASQDPAGGGGWAKLRQAQLKSLRIPATGMAVTIDVGSAGDIHPRNKEDVGDRLAWWALRNDYGKADRVQSGPLYKEKAVEGDAIRISFTSVGSGLMIGSKDGHGPALEAKDGTLKGFAIANAAIPADIGRTPAVPMAWHWAEAVIDGQTVVVSSPDVSSPVAVRYAFDMNPEGCNLYNKEGLPASPFQTDAE